MFLRLLVFESGPATNHPAVQSGTLVVLVPLEPVQGLQADLLQVGQQISVLDTALYQQY